MLASHVPGCERIHELAARDQRRDAFGRVLQRAMETKLGDDAEAVQKELSKAGISRCWVMSR